VAREAGTSALTPAELFEAWEGHLGSVEGLEQRFTAFNPRRVLFARADFVADADPGAEREDIGPVGDPGHPASIPRDAWS
jgi:hypothetical protein